MTHLGVQDGALKTYQYSQPLQKPTPSGSVNISRQIWMCLNQPRQNQLSVSTILARFNKAGSQPYEKLWVCRAFIFCCKLNKYWTFLIAVSPYLHENWISVSHFHNFGILRSTFLLIRGSGRIPRWWAALFTKWSWTTFGHQLLGGDYFNGEPWTTWNWSSVRTKRGTIDINNNVYRIST